MRTVAALIIAAFLPPSVFGQLGGAAQQGGSSEIGGTAGVGGSGTNIVFQGFAGPALENSGTPLSLAYTCASTANRLVISGNGNNHADTITLSDTAGNAAGAYHIIANDSPIGQGTENDWNAACPSGADTWTITSGSAAEMVLAISEYSGLSGSAGSWSYSTGTQSSGVVTATGTAATANVLAFLHTGIGTPGGNGGVAAPTAGWNWRQPNQGSHYYLDNTDVPSGSVSVSYTTSGLGSAGYDNYLMFLPGPPGTNPNWNPQLRQSSPNCSGSGSVTATFALSVMSGDTLVVGAAQEGPGSAPTISDSVGTSFGSPAVAKTGADRGTWIWVAAAGASGSDTVTITAGAGGSDPCAQIQEFSAGIGATVSDTGGNTTPANPMTWSQSVSTAQSVAFAFCTQESTNVATSTGATFSVIENGNAVGFGTVAAWARTVSTAGVTPVFQMPTSTHNVCASVVFH